MAWDDTPNLGLPYLIAAQAQKHVTHNEAIRMLDALVQLAVLDRTQTSSPGAPTDGDRHIIGAGATDDWAGHDLEVAAWQDGAWAFFVPREGWLAWVADEDVLVAWDGSAWVAAGGDSLNPASGGKVGINAIADDTNKLTVKSDATLFSHDDVTPGTGDMRQVLNKAAAGNTVSQLYQTSFSGRAETGLTGDDDFHFKVSPDGSTWYDGIVIDKDNGQAFFPGGTVREKLTAARTYYVRTDGDDGNDGLSNSAGGAFLTIQKAIDTVAALDISIYDVTIAVADGTYSSGQIVLKSTVGSGTVIIVGNTTTPGNVVISSSGNGFQGIKVQTPYRIVGVTLQTSHASAYAFDITDGTYVGFGRIKFATGANPWRAHFRAQREAIFTDVSGHNAYEIADSPAWYHIYCGSGGNFQLALATTVTLTGTPAWGFAFINSDALSSVLINSNVIFSGSATGMRYTSKANSVISTQGSGATFLPGDAPGSTANGGLYL
ncbi:MAG: DUF2793 domain-containing protein [Hyphomicrobiaceae bacterium]